MWEEDFHRLTTATARQQGLITRAQADRLGVTSAALDHLVTASLLVELDWEVYQAAGSLTAPDELYPLAGWIALSPELFAWERPGEDAVASHQTACQLLGLGTLPAPQLAFTVTTEHPVLRAVVQHRDELGPEDIVRIGALTVTSARRTVLDLVRGGCDHEDVGRVLSDAIRRDLVDLGQVHRELRPLSSSFGFPAEPVAFLEHFKPLIDPAGLSPRNRRAFTVMVSGHDVSVLQPDVLRLLTKARADLRYAVPPGADEPDASIAQDIAADIVAAVRTRSS